MFLPLYAFKWGCKFARSFSGDLLASSSPRPPFNLLRHLLFSCSFVTHFPQRPQRPVKVLRDTICMPWTNILANKLNYFRWTLEGGEGIMEGGININIWCDFPANLLCQMHHKHSTQTHLLGCLLSSFASFHSIFYIKRRQAEGPERGARLLFLNATPAVRVRAVNIKMFSRERGRCRIVEIRLKQKLLAFCDKNLQMSTKIANFALKRIWQMVREGMGGKGERGEIPKPQKANQLRSFYKVYLNLFLYFLCLLPFLIQTFAFLFWGSFVSGIFKELSQRIRNGIGIGITSKVCTWYALRYYIYFILIVMWGMWNGP